MTNELEKQFFDAFSIEPKSVKRTLKLAMSGYDESDLPEDLRQFISSQAQVYHVYPEITDHILLELICICNSTYINGYTNYFMATGKTKEELKEEILKKCITLSKDIKHQVLTLFKEW